MSKQWYYEVMGTAVGPISSAQLKQRVLAGKIPPDTPIRLGTDGKWQTADRIKGLLDPPVPHAKSAPPPAAATAVPQPSAPSAPLAAKSPAGAAAPPDDATYHFTGDHGPASAAPVDESHEYDFFRMVGFEQALGSKLHQLLCAYCQQHHVTMTLATRRAVAAFLDHKELAETKPRVEVEAPSIA